MVGPKWYRVTVTWTADVVVEVADDRYWPEIEIERAASRYVSSAWPDTESESIERLTRRPEQVDAWALADGTMTDTPPSVPAPPEAVWEHHDEKWCTNGWGVWLAGYAPTSRHWRTDADVGATASAILDGPRGTVPLARTITRVVDGVTEIVLRGEGIAVIVDADLLPFAYTTLMGGALSSGPAVWAFQADRLVAIVMTRKGEVPDA